MSVDEARRQQRPAAAVENGGIGMGGPWAAGMPLALEQWPARLRGLASGLLQGAMGRRSSTTVNVAS